MSKKKQIIVPESLMACQPVQLDLGLRAAAAVQAVEINPQNAPAGVVTPAQRIIFTTKLWGDKVRDITVGFMDQTTVAMRNKVLLYANKWAEFSKAKFRWTPTAPMVRISFGPGGYYSYLGTDILSIPANELTMNLEGFTVNTPDSEWMRVVPHEFGHTLGCPHEQQRQEILDLLDVQKTIAYFGSTQGWSESEVRQQILTPLDLHSTVGGSPNADQQSIMCYQFPGSITKSGRPIPGGNVISPTDKVYFAKIYPMDSVAPPPPVTPATGIVTLVALDAGGKEIARYK